MTNLPDWLERRVQADATRSRKGRVEYTLGKPAEDPEPCAHELMRRAIESDGQRFWEDEGCQ